MERDEVHGRHAWSIPSLPSTHPEWLKKNKINFIVQRPPSIPPDWLHALCKRFQTTMKDADFLAEAEKLRLEVMPSSAENMQLYWHGAMPFRIRS